ncbi:uncharacterized protein LOC109727189 isoform X3 [Ananas comosus]|uniref:Uncharacterized protein LOC109727189 isoform X3 n=1 Tax=Ananas comosus TaxID=4615 RepID=A0A6P5H632_ANACO|nr:uncharacterized protein LOC109727189 isoform X3 [Ananas comosus]
MAVLSVLPRPTALVRPTSAAKQTAEERGAMREVLRVVRRDTDFLRSAAAPLRKAAADIFWLRFLEDPERAPRRPPPASASRATAAPPLLPSSYPSGLSCVDLMMADLKALKLYFSYWRESWKIWSIPLPEVYEPQMVADYFSCRPHVLAFRIIEIFSSFVFAAIKLRTSGRIKFRRHGSRKDEGYDIPKFYIGQLIKETLLNLGPTFIKVGQSLSTRPDIIGPEISEALSELHEKVPPFPRDVAMKIIETELGCPIDSIYSYISDEPIAAASFGQVYWGCTVDGAVVAIKVQRPNLLHSVVRDIYILRLGLALLRKVAKRKSDPSLYADELGKGFVGELDYTIEAANASKFLETHSRYSFMLVPKVFRQFTRKRVLTMEWVIGRSPSELLLLSRGLDDRPTQYSERRKLEANACLLDLVNKSVEATLVQLLETGLLHADPHPGNLRYTPEGRIGFLDFGLLCLMEKRHQFAMLSSIVHIVNGDWGALVYDLTEMDVVPAGTNLRRVTLVLAKIWSVALKYHFRMPPYYTLVLRSVASLEGLAVAADQNFKTFQAAYPYVVRKLIYDNSAATRRILYSVVFNKSKELQWPKILLFLKLCSESDARKSRKDVNMPIMGESSRPSGYDLGAQEGVLEISNLILRLLSSKDGTVIRRLLMSADGRSLAQVVVSEDAVFLRQFVGRALADVIYQWMSEATGVYKAVNQPNKCFVAEDMQERDRDHLSSTLPSTLLHAVMRDRRLKVIFYKVLKDVRRDPVLMLRVGCSFFAILARAAILGFHRYVVNLSEGYLSSLSFGWRRALSIV